MCRYYPTETLNVFQAMLLACKRCCSFKGRSRCSEFWMCVLGYGFLNIICMLLTLVYSQYHIPEIMPAFLSVLNVVIMIPLIVRRYQDTGRSRFKALCFLFCPLMFYVFGSWGILIEEARDNGGYVSWAYMLTVAWIITLVVGYLQPLLYFVLLIAPGRYHNITYWPSTGFTDDSEVESNAYGPSPKYVDAETYVKIIKEENGL